MKYNVWESERNSRHKGGERGVQVRGGNVV